jgi:hypothetical protein
LRRLDPEVGYRRLVDAQKIFSPSELFVCTMHQTDVLIGTTKESIMFARAQEQLASSLVGRTDVAMLSCGSFEGTGIAYQPSGLVGKAHTAKNGRIFKRFAHRGILTGLCAKSVVRQNAAPARLWNPEDRP